MGDSSNDNSESIRITIIIGILAIFSALLIALAPQISKELTISNVMSVLIYGYFIIICYYFIFYILYKARSMTYEKSHNGTLPDDFTIVFNYVFLWLFRRKTIPKNMEKRKKLLLSSKRDYKYYYDNGVRLAALFPFIYGLILYSNIISSWIMSEFSVSVRTSYIIASSSYVLIFLILIFVFNFFRYKITGTQY